MVMPGEDPAGVFYLTGGIVGQYDINQHGSKIVVNVFRAPAFFPMSWAINKTPNTFFYEALMPVAARLAPANEVVQFIKDNPDVAFDLLRRVFRGTDGLLRRLAYAAGGSARSRLAFELVVECLRFGNVGKDGVYELHIKQDGLAARTGLARETISRELHKLEQDKLLILTPGGIRIPDVAGLESSSGVF